ncbi:MAG TPA: TetR/AcrR family transcriptional regulator [Vicinamibacterales bacterium]|jgi:AcrR family transcriptional regulator|nr:TetR/AcrR family transcriptional regulator [Vicinamibacterales bacterium]
MARTRSTRAHDAVLQAAARLFAERGIDATSMDAIAAASGVSKATIYKHWPDKDALCLEVMAALHGFEDELPDTNTGDLRADLLAVMGRVPPTKAAEIRQRILPHFMAYAARNPAFGQAWRTRVLEPPRIQLGRAIRRAIARGELPAAVNLDFAIGLLQGPPMYWFVRHHQTGEGPIAFDAGMVIDAFLRSQGWIARSQPSASAPRPNRQARTPRRR